MKATLPRSEALKSKKAKAEPRPSGVMLRSKGADTAPAKAPKSMSTPKAKANGSTKAPVATVTKPAPKATVASKATAPKAAAAKAAPPKPAAAAKVAPTPKPAAPAKAAAAATSSKTAAKAPAPSPKAASVSKPLTSKAGAAKTAPASAKPSNPEPSTPPPPKKPARKSIKEAAGVSTDAVARRTGKTWDDWFEVLDSAGAATLDQRGIIAILAQKHGIGPWWQQMIAVGYESLRAKTDKPPVADGFQISETCTLSAPVARVFKLWNDASERARWLADDRFVVKSATPGKALRARWGKGNSQVAVSFVDKAGKTEVAVEHQHIESQSAADQMKAYWQKKLGLLDEALAQRA